MMTRRFPRAVASLSALVAFVREFWAANGLEPARAVDLDLVLEELFTNMVRHARGGRPEIEVTLECRDRQVLLSLRDENVEPWNPDALPPLDLTRPAERAVGGRGIHLVRRMTRDLRFEHQGGVTTVTATLDAGAA